MMWSGCADCVRALIARRADARAKDRWGFTPLCWSAAGGHAEAAGLLLDAGAAVDGARRPQEAHLERHNQHAAGGVSSAAHRTTG